MSQTTLSQSAHPAQQTVLADEISFSQYLHDIWRAKWIILAGAALAALGMLVGLLLVPRDYSLDYTFDLRSRSLHSAQVRKLLAWTYGQEDVQRLVRLLESQGRQAYARKLARRASRPDQLAKMLDLDTVPYYLHPQYALDVQKANPALLEQITASSLQLLVLRVSSDNKDLTAQVGPTLERDLQASLARGLFLEHVDSLVSECRSQISALHDQGVVLAEDLRQAKAVHAALSQIPPQPVGGTAGPVVLNFDLGGKGEFLPLATQVTASQVRLIEIQEKQVRHDRDLAFQQARLGLLTQLRGQLTGLPPDQSIVRVREYLQQARAGQEGAALADVAASLLSAHEDLVATLEPVNPQPRILTGSLKIPQRVGLTLAGTLVALTLLVWLAAVLRRSQYAL
jgi:hypothetical protein